VARSPRVVVITGASSGIGRAAALRFASEGAVVVLAARRGEVLQQLSAECLKRGAPSAVAVATDVADAAAVDALAQTAVSRFGRIDVWVNDAAVTGFAPFLDMPLDAFRRIVDVNLMGYVHGARAALRVFRRQKEGVLINVSSVVAEIPQPYTTAYGMTKAAIRSLTTSIRQELHVEKQRGIHVVSVAPATVDTPIFRHAANYSGRAIQAMPPVYDVDLVARAIVKAAARPKPEVVVGTQIKAITRQHAHTPVAIENQLASQVDGKHLRHEKAPRTDGNLYEPHPDADAAATGGWSGKPRSAARALLPWLLTVGGGIVGWRLLRPTR